MPGQSFHPALDTELHWQHTPQRQWRTTPTPPKPISSWKAPKKRRWRRTLGVFMILMMVAAVGGVVAIMKWMPTRTTFEIALTEVRTLIENKHFLDAFNRLNQLEHENGLPAEDLKKLHEQNVIAWLKEVEAQFELKFYDHSNKELKALLSSYRDLQEARNLFDRIERKREEWSRLKEQMQKEIKDGMWEEALARAKGMKDDYPEHADDAAKDQTSALAKGAESCRRQVDEAKAEVRWKTSCQLFEDAYKISQQIGTYDGAEGTRLDVEVLNRWVEYGRKLKNSQPKNAIEVANKIIGVKPGYPDAITLRRDAENILKRDAKDQLVIEFEEHLENRRTREAIDCLERLRQKLSQDPEDQNKNEFLNQLDAELVQKSFADLNSTDDFKAFFAYLKNEVKPDVVNPLVWACFTECLLRRNGDELHPSAEDLKDIDVFAERDFGVTVDPYVSYVRGLAFQANQKWSEAAKSYEKAFSRRGSKGLAWKNDTRRKLAAKGCYEAGNQTWRNQAELALEYYQKAQELDMSPTLPEYLPGFVEAAYKAGRFEEFGKQLVQLLQHMEKFEALEPGMKTAIGLQFVEWAEKKEYKAPAEEMLQRMVPALKAALEEEKKNDALDFWMGKYYWQQWEKNQLKKDKEEALKWFGQSLIDSPPVHLRQDRRFKTVLGEIGDFGKVKDWQEVFKSAIDGDPEKRTERQWEIVIFRKDFIVSNWNLLERNLTEKEPGLIKDGREMASLNRRKKHIQLECEGHAIAINSINLGLGLSSPNNKDFLGQEGKGLFDDIQKKEKEREKAVHQRALVRLLSQEDTFKEWPWPKPQKWAEDFLKKIDDNDKYLDEMVKKELEEVKEKIRENWKKHSNALPSEGQGDLRNLGQQTKFVKR
jgi:hypothetical protein